MQCIRVLIHSKTSISFIVFLGIQAKLRQQRDKYLFCPGNSVGRSQVEEEEEEQREGEREKRV